MKGKRILSTGLAMAMMLALLAGLALAQQPAGSPLTAAFTYQGRLKSSGIPYTGACDFQFGLWDALSGGTQVGVTQTVTNVGLADGYFTVLLDWGADKFFGEQRWLEIYVRCPAGSGAYTPLTPRQTADSLTLRSVHHARALARAARLPPGFADGIDNDTTYSAGAGLTISGTIFSADTTYLQRRVSGDVRQRLRHPGGEPGRQRDLRAGGGRWGQRLAADRQLGDDTRHRLRGDHRQRGAGVQGEQ